MIKCVVWDLDHTLLSGVYLESPGPPPADPDMVSVLHMLRSRGIIHAIATRNPPEAAEYAAAAVGHRFAAAECGWGAKSGAIARLAAGLGLATDAMAFVDDEAYERAEVARTLPELLVLSPEDMAEAAGWPQFGPAAVTPEARQRSAMYAQRRVRQQEEAAFAGSGPDFLRYCQTRVEIAPARPADAARLHELSVRTHQFNSTGEQVSEASFRALIGAAGQRVLAVRLSDRFGDDGLVGGCLLGTGPQEWTVPLLMMSCRAIGRGVIDALLAWLARAAARDGAEVLTVPCRLSERNVPLRLALAAAGFRAAATAPGGQRAAFARPLPGRPLPGLPDWVRLPEER